MKKKVAKKVAAKNIPSMIDRQNDFAYDENKEIHLDGEK